MKPLQVSSVIALIISVIIFATACDSSSNHGKIVLPGFGSNDNTTGDEPGTGSTDEIKLVFVGDTMMDRKVKNRSSITAAAITGSCFNIPRIT
jgi:hypothetical protein